VSAFLGAYLEWDYPPAAVAFQECSLEQIGVFLGVVEAIASF
jgi:hypothetical protein